MIGTAVNTLNRVAIGNYGYTVKVDAAALLAYKITGIFASKDAGNTIVPITEETTLATLQGYCNSSGAPLCAFNFTNGELTIFFRGTGSDSPAWVTATAYAVNDIVKNAAGTLRARCAIAGKSGTPEPTFPSTSGGTVTDGTITWEYVDIIPRGDALPYATTTIFVIEGYRNAQNVSVDGDKLDVPDKDINLVVLYVRDLAWQGVKNYTPKNILDRIKVEENRIRLE